MIYTSFDGNPCLGRQVKFLVNFIDRSAGLLNSSFSVVKLNFNVLRDNLSVGVEKDNRVTFSHVNFIGQKGFSTTGGVSNDTSVLG